MTHINQKSSNIRRKWSIKIIKKLKMILKYKTTHLNFICLRDYLRKLWNKERYL